ncbi:MAG: HAD-IIA family hydrolase [Anaerolineae bacterium]
MPNSLRDLDALIVDLDGVLWRGAQPLPGVADFFNFLTANGVRFLLATNNAARPVHEILSRLDAMQAPVRPEQVLNSAQATALWLQRQLPAGASVLLIGEEGLYEAMAATSFRLINPTEPALTNETVAAVVVGLDRGFTYDKLRRATTEIRGGARFIATNTDATLPSENGVLPGAGSIIAAVQTATSIQPTIIGKPHRPLFDAALEILGAPPERTAMLGDRLDTDIEGGQQLGLPTILVLTGVTTPAQAAESPIKADFTFADLIELRQAWAQALG